MLIHAVHLSVLTAGRLMAVLALALLAIGCGDSHRPGNGQDVIFIIPGVAGGGPGYDGLIDGLRAGGCTQTIEVFTWGAPPLLFFMNFSSDSVHRDAEKAFADRIEKWKSIHPDGRIDIVGHSAGCGVALGSDVACNNLILLAPSVSPEYDLSPAMQKIRGSVHAFYSDRDTLFLKWRTGNFGTYDNIHTPAAGNLGFISPPPRVVQHPYEEVWSKLKNDGGHFGTLSKEFAHQILSPLLLEKNHATTQEAIIRGESASRRLPS